MADEERVARTPEELEEMIRLDELHDQTKMTPKDYARLRGISSPQLVYYHIRNGHLTLEPCICGRGVLDVDAADKYFEKGVYENDGKD